MRIKGFTLIELMIAVAIVAILAAVGYPSYQEHVRKGHRAIAKMDLERLQQVLAKSYATKFTYTGSQLRVKGAVITELPLGDINKMYDVTLVVSDTTVTGDTATLTAEPKVASVMKNDGKLTLANDGTACWYKNAGLVCVPW